MKEFNQDAIATFADSAFTGVKILSIENGIEDNVVFCHWNNESGDGKVSKSIIRYENKEDSNGDYPSYFMSRGTKYMMSDFIRTNI